MASRPRVDCPLCQVEVVPGQKLEDHLLEDHQKRELASFVIAEREALYRDAS